MDIKEGGDKIYEKHLTDYGEKPSRERTPPLYASSFFRINDGSLGGALRLWDVPRLVQKYGQAIR